MLDEDRLTGKIKAAYDNESDKNVDEAEARERTARAMARAFIEEVKAAKILVNGVQTAGTATAQTQSIAVQATIE